MCLTLLVWTFHLGFVSFVGLFLLSKLFILGFLGLNWLSERVSFFSVLMLLGDLFFLFPICLRLITSLSMALLLIFVLSLPSF